MNEQHDYRNPRTDPRLLVPVRVKVLRPFYVKGAPATVGEIVTVEEWVACDQCAIGRAVRV
jgi:hypothetical protein